MLRKRPKVMWILFDVDNGDDGDVKGYTWWFRTRQAARDHKKWQARRENNAELVGPYKYKKVGNEAKKEEKWQLHYRRVGDWGSV